MTAVPPLTATSYPVSPTPAAARAVGADRACRAVALWLFATAGMVFAMAVIGAITRLTESGLSMVEWRPLIGTIPPLTEAEWQRVFDLYRETPEYRYKNAGMDLAQFKEIFFWEWFHRVWGRMIGLVFAIPLLVFAVTGTIRRAAAASGRGGTLSWRLAGLFVLGGLQGLMGWIMVQSGLVDRPSVSQYRLAAHLSLAFLIFSLLVALGLSLWRQGAPAWIDRRRGLTGHGWSTVAVLAVTIVWGALVAGLDAGLAYNTWPLMNGTLLPAEAFSILPLWLNPFENTALVQFTHRWLAILAAAAVLTFAWQLWCHALTRRGEALAVALAAAVCVQVLLGITTLVLYVPIPIAAAHQAGALVLLGLMVAALNELHRPLARPRWV